MRLNRSILATVMRIGLKGTNAEEVTALTHLREDGSLDLGSRSEGVRSGQTRT